MIGAWILVLLLPEVALYPLSCGTGPWGVPELALSWHIMMSHNSLPLTFTTITSQALHKHQLTSCPRMGHPV